MLSKKGVYLQSNKNGKIEVNLIITVNTLLNV